MPKIRVSLKHGGAEITVIGRDPEEIEKILEGIPNLTKKIDDVIQRLESRETSYADLVRFDERGAPVLKVVDTDLTNKEAIMLLLYAAGDNGLTTADIGTQLNISGRVASGYPARITELKREGIITRRPTGEYVLTERGKAMARDIVRRLKEVVVQ